VRPRDDLVTTHTPELVERVRTARRAGYGWDAIREAYGVARRTGQKWCPDIQAPPRRRGCDAVLPSAPLRALIDRRGISTRTLKEKHGINVRWSRKYVSDQVADQIATLCRVHPAEVYGDLWWDVAPLWRDDDDLSDVILAQPRPVLELMRA
jgi:hypothetical protein